MDSKYHIHHGDCLDILRTLPEKEIQAIITSPPYAEQRKSIYGGAPQDEYVEWFLPRAAEMHRVLKNRGSFLLNIKEHVEKGQRQTYVMRLILALVDQGWLWTESYCWHKKNCTPGKWPNRFRDSWETIYHFTKQRKFDMYQERVMVPMGDWAQTRLQNLSEEDQQRHLSAVGSGFARNVSKWVDRDKAYPTNVLHLPTECSNKDHGAVFPVALPAWFVTLFSNPGDTIMDPFSGSGTTGVAAVRQGREYIGIDSQESFVITSRTRLKGASSNAVAATKEDEVQPPPQVNPKGALVMNPDGSVALSDVFEVFEGDG